MVDLVDVLQNEYNIERNKKVSIETRAGVFLTLLFAIIPSYFSVFVSVVNIYRSFTCLRCLKILLHLGFMIMCILTTLNLVSILLVKNYPNFNVDQMFDSQGKTDINDWMCLHYKQLVSEYRKLNIENAIKLKDSTFYIMSIILITIVSHII